MRDRVRAKTRLRSSSFQIAGTCVMARGWAPPEDQGHGYYQADPRCNNEWQQGRQAMCQSRFYSGSQNPKLSDVHHHKQYQTRLGHGCTPSAGVSACMTWFRLVRRALHQINLSSVPAVLPIAHTSPLARTSRFTVSRGRGGGPCSTSPVCASNAPS